MRIRSNDTLWTARGSKPFDQFKPLAQDVSCEVAVVGAGVSGAMVASHLGRKGVDVVVLDRAQPASSSTAACTALIQYELDQPLTAIAKIHDIAHATAAYQTTLQSLEWFETYVRSLDDDCELAARPTLLLAKRRWDKSAMQDEVTARQSAGIDVKWLDAATLTEKYNIDRPGAIESPKSFEVDPYRLTISALRDATGNGVRVFAPAEVCDYAFDDAGVTLRSLHGPSVRARKVIVANGYQTPPFLRQGYGDLLSTWAAVSEPIDTAAHWPLRQLIWEWGQAYLYARLVPDDRVIFGGGDENFIDTDKRDALIEKKIATLSADIGELIGTEITPQHRWAGTFAQTEDGMPYIGSHADCPHTYLALGYGGNGVTFSLIAARILTGIITDDQTLAAPAKLFAFDR